MGVSVVVGRAVSVGAAVPVAVGGGSVADAVAEGRRGVSVSTGAVVRVTGAGEHASNTRKMIKGI